MMNDDFGAWMDWFATNVQIDEPHANCDDFVEEEVINDDISDLEWNDWDEWMFSQAETNFARATSQFRI